MIDYVKRESILENGIKFYGIYGSDRLIKRCWLSDNEHLVFSTNGPFQVSTYIVHIGMSIVQLIFMYYEYGST